MIDVENSADGRVQTWWLDRPEARNALTLEMWLSLAELARRVEADREVRVVVVRGRHGTFCSGADITGLGRALAADTGSTHYRAANAAAERALAHLPVPTIAVIEGFCVGGGCQVAMACDLRLGHPACLIGVTPARLGISYPASSIARLAAVTGVGGAAELLLAGELVPADRALALGLLTEVAEDLDGALARTVDVLLQRSSFSQLAAKAVLNALVDSVDLTALNVALEAASLRAEDLGEGLAAFADKRPPRFGPRPDSSAR